MRQYGRPASTGAPADYHDVLLAAVPRPCHRALDVGCGVGRFARLLASHADEVVAIDRSAEVIARGRAMSAGVENLRFTEGDFLAHPIGPGSCDFVSFVASLHHMPFGPAVERAKDVLRPGGVLGVIGLWREHGTVDFLASAVAFPVSRFYRLMHPPANLRQPLAEPTLTLDEIRAQAAVLLPGVRVRRHLLWRYSLIWTKP
jgi:SAM-dependent methyltransferase